MSEPFDACPTAPEDETPLHCECWYGAAPCCWCGDDTTDDECPKCEGAGNIITDDGTVVVCDECHGTAGHHPTEVEA